MLKNIIKFLLAALFIWALAFPFLQSDESGSDEQTSSEQSKKQKKKEKPLHSVTLPKFSEFADVKDTSLEPNL